jgi:serine/threonine protein kinase
MNLSSLPGTVLDGRYFIERQLGQGGMGAVFAAQHVGTTRTVAVKIIVPQLADQDEFLLRFQREAEAAGRLRHPNIVNVTDFGFTLLGGNQIAYLVMEFLDGESLHAFLKHTPQPPMDLILEILEQTALGLDAAHAAGIVHRDLKPDNIGLESNRRGGFNIKILDFGIAKLADPASSSAVPPPTPKPTFAKADAELETMAATVATTSAGEPAATRIDAEFETVATNLESETAFIAPERAPSPSSMTAHRMTSHRMTGASVATLQTTVGAVLGTPAFMPPEQCQGDLVDHRADVYSLAVIAYQLFCGRLPFEARTVRELIDQQINSKPPAPRDLDQGISPGVSNAILKGLSKNPEDRQMSTGMLAAQIRAGAKGELGILSEGKFYTGAYPETFFGLLAACFAPVCVSQFLVTWLAGVMYREKLVPTAALLLVAATCTLIPMLFLSQCYKAGCAMILEDASKRGFFRPHTKEIFLVLVRQVGQLLRMFFSIRNWTSYSTAALWPNVWVSEGLVGRAALERARLLGSSQPEAAFALFGRQYSVMLMASIASMGLMVFMTGSAQETATVLFSGQAFGWFFALYPLVLTAIFLPFGPGFHFLYRASRRCVGEEVANSLPAGSRTKRAKKTYFVRPGTLLAIVPPLLLTGYIVFRLTNQTSSTLMFLDAMNEGRRNFVLRSIDSGTPVDTVDLRKRTPLMHAIMDGDLEFVRQLLAKGAQIESRSNNGATPLIVAIATRRTEAANLLLDRGANVNAIDDRKRTALMIAAIQGDVEGCKLLLSRGANKDLTDADGKSALDHAREDGYTEIAALLGGQR